MSDDDPGWTDDYADAAELRDLFSLDDEDDVPTVVRACDGEWRRVSDNLWRFWEYAE